MADSVQARPDVEEYDLADEAAESDVAVAEHLLAELLTRCWLEAKQDRQETPRGQNDT